ncbi:uncharacterized protein LOC113333814 isoform X2 [Papaver somniferum]|uniref:uncharacterized protein LOC113333814 isoform X2 n=1 Tax=Papaver somniferum TaxID=3469 RepID=UPI000E6FC9E5|nr:uncharacterized protein LOC113333814 isoform X2 [Papaver somniferum]
MTRKKKILKQIEIEEDSEKTESEEETMIPVKKAKKGASKKKIKSMERNTTEIDCDEEKGGSTSKKNPDLNVVLHKWILMKKKIWFAEQTKIVEPNELRKDKFVPRASRWNLKHICKDLLKDMDASNYLFRENFFDEITQNERVALGMIEEGRSISLVENREERNQNLSMEIKASWQVMQNLIANNEEVHPKMEEMLNKLHFQACPKKLKSLPNSFKLKNDTTVDSDSAKERQVTTDVSSSVQSKNDTTPAAMMCITSNDACVTPAEDLQDDSVNVQSNKATTDYSFERDPIIDFVTRSMGDISPLPSQETKVELVFDESVLEDNIEHEKLQNFTQLDDTDEVVENMSLSNILMTMKVYCIVFFYSLCC